MYNYLYEINNPSNIIAAGYTTFLDVNGNPTYDATKYAVGSTTDPSSITVTSSPSILQKCVAIIEALPQDVQAAFAQQISEVFVLLNQNGQQAALTIVQAITLPTQYSQYQTQLNELISILQGT